MSETLLVVILWGLIAWIGLTAMYALHLVAERRNARPSAILSASTDSTLIGTVAEAAAEIASPVLGEPPCVLWERLSSQISYKRLRPFAVRSADAGVVWIEIDPSVWSGQGWRSPAFTRRGIAHLEEQARLASRDREDAECEEPSDAPQRLGGGAAGDGAPELLDDTQQRDDVNGGNAAVRWSGQRVKTLRVGDEVILRGRFGRLESRRSAPGTPDQAVGYRVTCGPGWRDSVVIHVGGRSALRRSASHLLGRVAVFLILGYCAALPLWALGEGVFGVKIVRLLGLESLVTK